MRKTGRLITVDTGWRVGGLGAELVAEITERAFADLKQAPRRIGLPDHPTPSSRALATPNFFLMRSASSKGVRRPTAMSLETW